MLELLGSSYVIDHVICEHNARRREEEYRIYVTDMLKGLAESWGNTVSARYYDLTNRKKEEPENGDEAALKVIRALGLKGKNNGLHETEGDSVA